MLTIRLMFFASFASSWNAVVMDFLLFFDVAETIRLMIIIIIILIEVRIDCWRRLEIILLVISIVIWAFRILSNRLSSWLYVTSVFLVIVSCWFNKLRSTSRIIINHSFLLIIPTFYMKFFSRFLFQLRKFVDLIWLIKFIPINNNIFLFIVDRILQLILLLT